MNQDRDGRKMTRPRLGRLSLADAAVGAILEFLHGSLARQAARRRRSVNKAGIEFAQRPFINTPLCREWLSAKHCGPSPTVVDLPKQMVLGGLVMATGKRAASSASRILRNPASSKRQKKVAASDLSQAPRRKKRRS